MMLHVFTPAEKMPWPVLAPFRMLPGMQRHPGPVFEVSDQDQAYQAAKRHACAQGQGCVGQPDPAVLTALARQYQVDTGQTVSADLPSLITTLPEDFVVLHDEPGDASVTHRQFKVRFLSVCFASNWNPAEKLGMTFARIHAPVADNQRLLASQAAIETMAFRQHAVRRHVWLLSPDPHLHLDPARRRDSWQSLLQSCGRDDQTLLASVMFRVECQTTLPLPYCGRAVFLIRVLVCPLSDVLAIAPQRAAELAAALRSMSDAVLEYRGMQAIQPRLLQALASTA